MRWPLHHNTIAQLRLSMMAIILTRFLMSHSYSYHLSVDDSMLSRMILQLQFCVQMDNSNHRIQMLCSHFNVSKATGSQCSLGPISRSLKSYNALLILRTIPTLMTTSTLLPRSSCSKLKLRVGELKGCMWSNSTKTFSALKHLYVEHTNRKSEREKVCSSFVKQVHDSLRLRLYY